MVFNLFLRANKRVSPVIHERESSSVKFAYGSLLLSSVVIGFLLVGLFSDLDLVAIVGNIEKFIVISLVVVAVSIVEISAK